RARYGALLRAFEAQRSKLVEERLRYAEIVATLERKEPGRARDAGELAALRERVEVLESGLARRELERATEPQAEVEKRLSEAAALLAEQDRLLRTRLLRAAAALQKGLARLRGRR
ncbi:MAG TPA: hypothetical protein VNW71_24215, partial [Thermoanaerobaculia bacterium]|nr:hypothetical protein [Thermoanaerobaculia bacterium]